MMGNYNWIHDDNYKQYATKKQWEKICAMREHGSARAAARAMNASHAPLIRQIAAVKKKAEASGYIPENGLTEPFNPMLNHQKSTVHIKDGKVVQYWARMTPDQEKIIEAQKAMLEAFQGEIPKLPKVKSPKHGKDDLLNCYILTDYHLGMLAHAEETHDADWDLKKAEDLLMRWFAYAIANSPKASNAIFVDMGDFLHWDGLDAVTPTSKHVLDADSRFHKIVRVATRCRAAIIQMMLKKYKHVHVKFVDANHDPASQVHARENFAFFLADNPRVEVDVNPSPYVAYEFGGVSLFFHHGHKKGIKDIDRVFANMYSDIFYRTQHRYGHMGHLHTNELLETLLMIIERHETNAPNDAYASRGGWNSKRSSKVITYHRDFGELTRLVITPAMIDALG